MRKSNENSRTNCDDIEGLLIQRHFDEITQNQSLSVEEHLKSCDRCGSFQNTLSNLQNLMQIGVADKLTPHPAIRENIVQRMRTAKLREARNRGSIWQYLRNIFQYRVPVYQVLFGMVLILLIFVAPRQFPLSSDQKAPKKRRLTQTEVPILSQLSVMNNLEIVEAQRIGQNIKEDTTLTRFIVTAM